MQSYKLANNGIGRLGLLLSCWNNVDQLASHRSAHFPHEKAQSFGTRVITVKHFDSSAIRSDLDSQIATGGRECFTGTVTSLDMGGFCGSRLPNPTREAQILFRIKWERKVELITAVLPKFVHIDGNFETRCAHRG